MEGESIKMPLRAHTLTLEGRSRAKLAGVTAVSCFNDQEVVLETSEGEVALLGENLHIEQLNLDDGQLDVTGSISGIEYSDRKEKRGLFSRRRK
ncbi:MAG: YabP/YqfC family sporulation protein [Clostridia bacterium]|nr:YabP/YqfC family sporulation protein [Clostridia bacterium]